MDASIWDASTSKHLLDGKRPLCECFRRFNHPLHSLETNTYLLDSYSRPPFHPHTASFATLSSTLTYSSTDFAPTTVKSRRFPSNTICGTLSTPLLTCSRISILVSANPSNSSAMKASASACGMPATWAAVRRVGWEEGCAAAVWYWA